MLLALTALLLLTEKLELIQPLAGSKSNQLEVQSGGLVFREGEAGSAFGSVRVGTGKRQFSYYLIVKHDLGQSEKSDFGEEANAKDGEGETKQTLTIDMRALEAVYKVSVEGKKVKETLTLNKKEIDLSKGRVLLVDMTPGGPKWEQIKADLTGEASAATKKEADALAKKTLASLAKQDRKVKEFLDKAK